MVFTVFCSVDYVLVDVWGECWSATIPGPPPLVTEVPQGLPLDHAHSCWEVPVLSPMAPVVKHMRPGEAGSLNVSHGQARALQTTPVRFSSEMMVLNDVFTFLLMKTVTLACNLLQNPVQ